MPRVGLTRSRQPKKDTTTMGKVKAEMKRLHAKNRRKAKDKEREARESGKKRR